MSEAISAATGAVGRYELVEFGDIQRRVLPFKPGAAEAAAPVKNLAENLAHELKATSDAYRRALAQAVDPLSPGALAEGLKNRTDGVKAVDAAGAGRGAGAGETSPLGVERKGAVEEIGPTKADGASPTLKATDAALEESVALMMKAHSEIMKRQVSVMAATATLEASTSGARSAGQNVDTLLRGA